MAVHRPSIEQLPEALREAARAVARRMRAGGHEAWIVGGAVRDLALGRLPKDLDMTSPASPQAVLALWPKALELGRAFGTIQVRSADCEVQITTFRREGGYSDGRRPDRVVWGESLEEDAARRDFTCNALYLEPLEDRFEDPTGGLDDLQAGLLRPVGEARQRFREDGLRLFRMARFAAGYGLTPAPGVREAARDSLDALRGVSAERIRAELEGLFAQTGALEGLNLLARTGVLERALGLAPDRRRDARLAALPAPWSARIGWALLMEGEPLSGLKLSRSVQREVESLWALKERCRAPGTRAQRMRLFRDVLFEDACALARAQAQAQGSSTDGLEALARERVALREELERPAWIGAEDLVRAGLEPGPRFGELLFEAETRQLEGELVDRDAALAWLSRRLADQDGGK